VSANPASIAAVRTSWPSAICRVAAQSAVQRLYSRNVRPVAHVVAEDDWVMGRAVATATHTTAAMGLPPTGKQVVTTFWDLHRFDDEGLIVETWNLMDGLALMHQLGLLPAP
jgi:hypothetical protein